MIRWTIGTAVADEVALDVERGDGARWSGAAGVVDVTTHDVWAGCAHDAPVVPDRERR